MTTTSFDPVVYKQTTREQWQEAAEAWDRWGPTLEEWLGPATELMLDQTDIRPGARVLDLAAGAGGQTIAAARRVGPSGSVLATDISPAILGFAGIPAGPATVATVLAAVFGSLLMGVYANRPIAVAPYMGENAFIAFGPPALDGDQCIQVTGVALPVSVDTVIVCFLVR